MMKRFLLAMILSMSVGGVAYAASDAKTTAPVPNADPVVARVNGTEIHRSEVARFYSQLPAQVQQIPFDSIFSMLVDRVVEEKLLVAAGYKANLQDSEEVKEDRRLAEERAVERLYLRQEIERRVTPEALDAAYKKFTAEFKPQEEIRASHILVENEAEAKAIVEELNKGGDFAKLAKEKSKDTGSAANGGDLGYFPAEAMVEPFAKAAFAMKTGEITKTPVQTNFGWHVIKVVDRRMSPIPTLAEAKPQLEEKLREEITDAVVKDLKSGAKIEVFQADGSPVKAEKPAKAKKKK